MSVDDLQQVFVTSLDELAVHVGVSLGVLKSNTKLPGFPPKIDGKGYDVAATMIWRAKTVNKRSDQKKPGEPAQVHDLNALRALKTISETKLNDIKIAQLERKTIPAADIDDFHLHLSSRLKSLIYQRFVTECPPKTCGLDVVAVRRINREYADAFCGVAQDMLDTWAQEQAELAEAARHATQPKAE